jgi:hypothetical protein
METPQETQDILDALKRQAEPTHPPRPEITKSAGAKAVKANIIFYRGPDAPDEPEVRLAA